MAKNKNRLYLEPTESPQLWLTIPMTINKSLKKSKLIKEEVKVPLYLNTIKR